MRYARMNMRSDTGRLSGSASLQRQQIPVRTAERIRCALKQERFSRDERADGISVGVESDIVIVQCGPDRY